MEAPAPAAEAELEETPPTALPAALLATLPASSSPPPARGAATLVRVTSASPPPTIRPPIPPWSHQYRKAEWTDRTAPSARDGGMAARAHDA